MKFPIASLQLLLWTALSAPAVDHLTVIGDSLTKEYEVTYPGLPGLVAGIDETNPGARNWAEILHARRNAHFDSGIFRNSLFNRWMDMRLLGHEYNWAIPGAPARTLRNLLTDPNGAELAGDADFNAFAAFAPEWQQTPARLAAQLASTSYAAVIWAGSNDLRYGSTDPAAMVGGQKIRYQTIYEGDGTGAGDPQLLMASIKASVQTIAQFARASNATLPIAVCAVPHIGCAPAVKASWPTDSQRTGRITSALDALNAELKVWTETTLGGAWVDTNGFAKTLISGNLDIGGVTLINGVDTKTASDPTPAHSRYAFCHDGFHPTSSVQVVIAQKVQAALLAKYPEKFGTSPPLTDRELLNFLGIPVSTGFDEFMASSGAPAGQRSPDQDADGDGLTNIVEFALAGNDGFGGATPVLPVSSVQSSGGVSSVSLTWVPRYATNVYAVINCQKSVALDTWTDVPGEQIVTNSDGSVTAVIPNPGATRLFLRLQVTVTP